MSIIHAVTSGFCMIVGMHLYMLNLNVFHNLSVLLPSSSRLESRPLARDLGIGKGSVYLDWVCVVGLGFAC